MTSSEVIAFLGQLEYEGDDRRAPDSSRLGRFKAGWGDATDRGCGPQKKGPSLCSLLPEPIFMMQAAEYGISLQPDIRLADCVGARWREAGPTWAQADRVLTPNGVSPGYSGSPNPESSFADGVR